MADYPSEQTIIDTIEEVERCLWRAQEASDEESNDHLDEADGEIMDLLRGLDDTHRLALMDRLVRHLETQAGMDPGLIEEVFNNASLSREDLDAYRLSQETPPAQAAVSRPRI